MINTHQLSHLRMRQLRLIVFLAQGLTLAQIAGHLHVSAAAVSVMLQELEAALGVSLCERDRRGARATPTGRLIAQRAQVLLQEFSNFEADLQNLQQGQQVLRLGAIPQATLQWVPRVARAYQQQGGGQLLAHEGTSSQLLLRVRAGELSAAITRVGANLVADTQGLRMDLLGAEQVGVVLDQGHPLHQKIRPRPTDLAQLEWVLPEPGAYIRNMLELYFQRHGLGQPRMVLQVDTTAQAMWCAAQMGCAAAGPLSLLQHYAASWSLQRLALRLGDPVKLGFFYRPSQLSVDSFVQLRAIVQGLAKTGAPG